MSIDFFFVNCYTTRDTPERRQEDTLFWLKGPQTCLFFDIQERNQKYIAMVESDIYQVRWSSFNQKIYL